MRALFAICAPFFE